MLGPVNIFESFNEAVGKIGDFEKPTRHFFLYYFAFTTLAYAVHHLLIGKHCFARIAPVGARGFFIDKVMLKELREQPLRPLVIFRR